MNITLHAKNLPEETEAIIERYPDPTGRILNILNDIQTLYRYLPEEALAIVTEKTGIPLTRLHSFGDFFSRLSLDPVGRYIMEVCDGTACHAAGAPKLINALEEKLGLKEGETTEDGLVTLRKVHCIGACSLAPVIIVDDQTYGRVRLNQVGQIINTLERDGETDEQ